MKYFDQFGRSAIFFLVGGAFLAAYFYRKEFGFLIPGCLLLGLAGGSLGRTTFFADGQATLLGLGFGFAAITVIGLVYEREFRAWALIPASVLILLGFPNTGPIIRYVFENWPLILVAVGVMILIGSFGRPPAASSTE